MEHQKYNTDQYTQLDYLQEAGALLSAGRNGQAASLQELAYLQYADLQEPYLFEVLTPVA